MAADPEARLSFFIHPNQCLIFFRDPGATVTPARMKQVLIDSGVSVDGDGEPFVLQWGDGPKLHASIIGGASAGVWPDG